MLASFVIMTAIVIFALVGKAYIKRYRRSKTPYRRTYDAWNRSRGYRHF